LLVPLCGYKILCLFVATVCPEFSSLPARSFSVSAVLTRPASARLPELSWSYRPALVDDASESVVREHHLHHPPESHQPSMHARWKVATGDPSHAETLSC